VGVYAGSMDSYFRFNKFFDKILMDYHNYSPDFRHPTAMNAFDLKCPPFNEDEAALIISVRVRVARNFAKYPFTPAISED